MADKPILFSGPMVRALLEGRKTQTRRVMKGVDRDNCVSLKAPTKNRIGVAVHAIDTPNHPRLLPISVAVGDRLYVREAWHAARSLNYTAPRDISHDSDIEHAATARSYAEIGLMGKLRPGIFLPRWASRITLIVTDVRVERVQAITDTDAAAEGCSGCLGPNPDFPDEWDPAPAEEFRDLWDSLNAKRGFGWDANPWVAAITFRVIRANIDEVPA